MNRLANQSSPYLRQHRNNPVHWHPWTPDTIQLARSQDKPLFVSIGYSTCHWCHVMERESFEDAEIAQIINNTTIAVKVDREEHPDVDHFFMEMVLALRGQGGWPLSAVVTPELAPIFAGTYLPPENRHGQIGVRELFTRIGELWSTDRETIRGQALHNGREIRGLAEGRARGSSSSFQEIDGLRGRWDWADRVIETAVGQFAQSYDSEWGGFGPAPKFPSPHNLSFLAIHGRSQGSDHSTTMVINTIKAMARGGLWDHIGGGWHRYSTDREWLVPHFEKMLYDQGTMVRALVQALPLASAQLKPWLTTLIEATCAFVDGELHRDRGFASALDADSDGEEGLFYLWTHQELAGKDQLRGARLFGIEPRGNFHGPHAPIHPLNHGYSVANGIHWPPDALHYSQVEGDGAVLVGEMLKLRNRRNRPSLDDKILTDWNSLYIGARARVHWLDPSVDSLPQFLAPGTKGPLAKRINGTDSPPAIVDDYAFAIDSLILLHQATQDWAFIERATELQGYQDELFWSEKLGFYSLGRGGASGLPYDSAPLRDGAYPAGNSTSLHNLGRLYLLQGDQALLHRSQELLSSAASSIERAPMAHSHWLSSLPWFGSTILGGASTMVIAAPPKVSTKELEPVLTHLRQDQEDYRLIVVNPPADGPYGVYSPVDGAVTAYLCRNFSCQLPQKLDPSSGRFQLG